MRVGRGSVTACSGWSSADPFGGGAEVFGHRGGMAGRAGQPGPTSAAPTPGAVSTATAGAPGRRLGPRQPSPDRARCHDHDRPSGSPAWANAAATLDTALAPPAPAGLRRRVAGGRCRRAGSPLARSHPAGRPAGRRRRAGQGGGERPEDDGSAPDGTAPAVRCRAAPTDQPGPGQGGHRRRDRLAGCVHPHDTTGSSAPAHRGTDPGPPGTDPVGHAGPTGRTRQRRALPAKSTIATSTVSAGPASAQHLPDPLAEQVTGQRAARRRSHSSYACRPVFAPSTCCARSGSPPAAR